MNYGSDGVIWTMMIFLVAEGKIDNYDEDNDDID